LLARIDLNSSQKCNKMITEAEEKEGRGAEESLSAFPEREKGKIFTMFTNLESEE